MVGAEAQVGGSYSSPVGRQSRIGIAGTLRGLLDNRHNAGGGCRGEVRIDTIVMRRYATCQL